MGKYKHLLSNTLLFALSTFSSRLLVFLMLPLYTRMLNTEQYGAADIIQTTCNLLVPVMTLTVHEAVVRFGMEKNAKKSDVFTMALLVIAVGYAVLWLCYPLLRHVEIVGSYTRLVYLYVLTAALRSTVTNFVRSTGLVRLFAMDGVLTTVMTVGLNVLFLVVLRLGVEGYILAVICADAFSALSLFLLLRLYRFIKPLRLDRRTAGEMLRYCAPLMPTAVFWWVVNLSDRYFITYMLDVSANGLYSAASKLPGAIMLVSAIFIQAWQLSAFDEYKRPGGEAFYSTIFRSYCAFVFLAASGIILLVKPITKILVYAPYFESWRFVPFLVLAVSFSCLVTFLGTIYNAAKRNAMVTITTLTGALINIVLNWKLIPVMGANGAALATFISYFAVFLIRAVDTRRYIALRIQPVRMGVSLALLLAQVWVSLTEPPFAVWVQLGVLLLLVACNLPDILFLLRRLRELAFAAGTKRA